MVPPLFADEELAQIFAFKREVLVVGGARWQLVDALLKTPEERFVTLPFVRIIDGSIVWHRAHRTVSQPVLDKIGGAIRSWLDQLDDNEPRLQFFAEDAAVASLVVDESVAAPLLPGLAAYARVFDEADRYAALAAYVHNSHVIDLNARSGFGASLLAAHAHSVYLDPAGMHDICKRFSYARTFGEKREQYDVAVAVGVTRDRIGDTLARASVLLGEHGRTIATTADQSCAHEFETRGFDVRPLVRPDGDANGSLNEWVAVRAPSTEAQACTTGTVHATVEAARPLRVLMVLRPSADQAFGGDVVQVRETAAALERRGHSVVVTTAAEPNASGFDVVHLTNLTSPFETLGQARALERFSGPIVLMPIFIDHADETVWGMRTVPALFAADGDDDALVSRLASLANRTVTVEHIPPPPGRPELMPSYLEAQLEILARSDYAIANAHTEMHRVYRYLSPDLPYAVAPSCADSETYGPHARHAFEKRYGLRDFVLTTGRLEPRKNQLLLFEAVRKLGYPLVCIGRGVESAYAQLVRAYRPLRTTMLPFLSEAELAGAYAAARVVAMPSWDEVVSLSSLNAAVSESSLVLTRNSGEHEYFGDDAFYCDPGSVESITTTLERAWTTHDARAARRSSLRRRVISSYSWDESARLTEEAYYRVLSFNPRGDERRRRFASA